MATPTLEEISATLQDHAVFAVIAETLAAFQPPSTPEGRRVLHEHYLWAKEAYEQGRLLFAGPLDLGGHGPGAPPSIGAPTGLLVFRAASKAEAEEIALQVIAGESAVMGREPAVMGREPGLGIDTAATPAAPMATANRARAATRMSPRSAPLGTPAGRPPLRHRRRAPTRHRVQSPAGRHALAYLPPDCRPDDGCCAPLQAPARRGRSP
jgi:uncharacterized protein YciI